MIENRKLRLRATVERRGEASAHLQTAGDAVLIERGRPRMLLLACPCGCGEEFPINLDSRAGPAWRLYGDPEKGISVFPSVWRESGCRSHYIIWRGTIFLFGRDEEEIGTSLQPAEIEALVEAVRKRLPTNSLIPFSEIADQIDAVPWDVLMVCRRLVRDLTAREGTGKQRGHFGRLIV